MIIIYLEKCVLSSSKKGEIFLNHIIKIFWMTARGWSLNTQNKLRSWFASKQSVRHWMSFIFYIILATTSTSSFKNPFILWFKLEIFCFSKLVKFSGFIFFSSLYYYYYLSLIHASYIYSENICRLKKRGNYY